MHIVKHVCHLTLHTYDHLYFEPTIIIRIRVLWSGIAGSRESVSLHDQIVQPFYFLVFLFFVLIVLLYLSSILGKYAGTGQVKGVCNSRTTWFVSVSVSVLSVTVSVCVGVCLRRCLCVRVEGGGGGEVSVYMCSC
jgi:hypothetical protein